MKNKVVDYLEKEKVKFEKSRNTQPIEQTSIPIKPDLKQNIKPLWL